MPIRFLSLEIIERMILLRLPGIPKQPQTRGAQKQIKLQLNRQLIMLSSLLHPTVQTLRITLNIEHFMSLLRGIMMKYRFNLVISLW